MIINKKGIYTYIYTLLNLETCTERRSVPRSVAVRAPRRSQRDFPGGVSGVPGHLSDPLQGLRKLVRAGLRVWIVCCGSESLGFFQVSVFGVIEYQGLRLTPGPSH